jgi:hypothetical protein
MLQQIVQGYQLLHIDFERGRKSSAVKAFEAFQHIGPDSVRARIARSEHRV